MNNSKLAYLSKYTDSGPSDEKVPKKSKKKKSSKKSKRKDGVDGSAAAAYTSTVVDLDVDDTWMKDDDEGGRINTTEEDGPLIVSGHQWKDQVGDLNASHDHASDDDSGIGRNISRRQRHDSSDEDEPIRRLKRHDSSDEDESIRRRRRHDSSSDESRSQVRRRHDKSDSDVDVRAMDSRPIRKRHDSSDDESDAGSRPTKMSSGHSAGLQNASQFSKAEAILQEKKKRKLAKMKDSGEHSETVYRDNQGRKVDMIAKFNESQREKREKELKEQAEKLETQKGFVQKLQEENLRREEDNIKNAPFARSRDDDQLETMLKETLRAEGKLRFRNFSKQVVFYD